MTVNPTPMEDMEYREGFAGGCYVNNTGTCVAQPEDYCDEDTFVTAHYLRANKGHPLRYCAGQLENVAIGRCGDSGQCSNFASRCLNETTFVPFDPNCTITTDLSFEGNGTSVTYGKCNDRCVWSEDDCLAGEVYVSNDEECTSDKVEIGACWAGHAFCAVGPKSCTQPGQQDEPFWMHHEVKENVEANCYLSSLPKPAPPPTLAPVRAVWTKAPTRSPSEFTPTTLYTDTSNDTPTSVLDENGKHRIPFNNDMFQTGALVAAVAVFAIILGVVIGLSTVYCKREEEEEWRADKKNSTDPPTEIIDISHQIEYAESSLTDF